MSEGQHTKTHKSKPYRWTRKRRVALECLIRSGGNVRIAAEAARAECPGVSEDYIRDLKYRDDHRPFREEYRRRCGELLDVLEVGTLEVIEGVFDLTKKGIPPGVRLRAWQLLGDYAGTWPPSKLELMGFLRSNDWAKIRGAIQRALADHPEAREDVARALRGLDDER